MALKEAIDLAVRECIEENILRDFLEQHRRKMCDIYLTKFDEKKYKDVLREKGRLEERKRCQHSICLTEYCHFFILHI